MKLCKHVVILLFIASMMMTSCNNARKKYVIGVSQCSEDSWRSKLKAELEQSTYFYDDVELRICSANDDVEQQRAQIRQLVEDGVDLLIASPQQTASLSAAIKTATDKNIPVILFDRKSDVKEYNAFMGADNYAIGEMLGEYVAGQLGEKGNIIEIAGEHGSSPALERHRGFNDAIKKYPGMKVIGFAEGDWKQPSGEKAMMQILSTLKDHGPINIDCVFGGNDRMALGARKALERFVSAHPDLPISSPSKVIYVGVDALPTVGGGIEMVRDGKLTASAIYPTHGDDLVNLALRILKDEPFEKQNPLETSIVTSANASVLLMQYKEILQQDDYIKKMHTQVDSTLRQLDTERFLLVCIVLIVLIVSAFLVVSVRMVRTKHKLNEELSLKNEELSKEKEIAERQRDELEEQRDKLIEATMQRGGKTDQGEASTDEQGQPVKYENEFMAKFMEAVENNMKNSDLSVEDLGEVMCLSRVQLYRKVKSMTGKSPVEIIREQRLLCANHLLCDSSLSISEIAYRVGFSSPSYFTKCYRDFFGKSPTEVR